MITAFIVLVASAAPTALLIVVLHPILRRHAMSEPNSRSSHTIPTPQGGGLAVMTVTLAVAAFALFQAEAGGRDVALPLAAALLLVCVGATDDFWNIAIGPRLFLQGIAVMVVVAALPIDLRAAPILPWWVERTLLVGSTLWFVNLTNFMDGIDWMTVAEVVPITAALSVLGMLGALPQQATFVALALCGAMLGFAPFNKPVAKLFLGDAGSLPIGLLLGWLLIVLAGNGHGAAAVLLPLYYIADATITLGRRMVCGEPFWEAHRQHFYQRAFDGGRSPGAIVARVFALNVALAMLALVTALVPGPISALGAVGFGAALTAWLLHWLAANAY